MPHKYDLQLISAEDGKCHSVSGEFSDEAWELFQEFDRYAEELIKTKFFQSNEWGNLNLTWNGETNQITTITTLPEWDDVTVFLHKFRPLLLNDERTNFYKIHNMLSRELDDPHIRDVLKQQQELFSGKTAQSGMQLRSNDILLNSEKVLFDWLNSHEFHRDKDKREFIGSLHQIIPLDASKVIFLRLLTDKAFAVWNLASFIALLMGKQDTLNVRVRVKAGERLK
jgi:hypothetical protein